MTTEHRISCISGITFTQWIMIENTTFGILTADISTRILAFIVDAGSRFTAIGIQNTFGATFNVRITNIVSETLTRSGSITFHAMSIYTTRTRLTRTSNFNGWCYSGYRKENTLLNRIS